MKQALEALEPYARQVVEQGNGYETAKCDPKVDAAITALRLAIEQAEKQEPVAMRYDFDGYGYKYIDSGSGSNWQTRHKGAEPLYEAPPQQEKQEPVATVTSETSADITMSWWHEPALPVGTKLYTAPPQRQPLTDSVREMRDVQGRDGTWNYDPYMHGLYNGLEFAVSLLEQREPQFKDAPKQWLCDLPKPRTFSSAHGIGGGE
jgi:hypothetical protein